MKKNRKNLISEEEIIYKYLSKLNFKKKEAFDFHNDGALLKSKKNKNIVVTNDGIIEGIDFFNKDSASSIAQKIFTYNLSDLSSMGATPYSYTLCLSLPDQIGRPWIEEFTSKLFFLQRKYNIFLVGGDIGKSNQINISANFYGYVKKNSILKRNTSKVGDSIWVTGNIGQSHIGLLIAQKKILLSKKLENYYLKHYLFPNPCMFGSKIINYANSCIDISDGFSGDLFKLINNKYGINLYFDELPFSYQTKILLNKKIISISELLNGGDDYELLFTCSPKKDIKIINMALKNRIKITKIGRITHQKDTLSNVSKLKYFNKSYQYLF
jgi:thiamine-monophosphate kinase